MQKDIGTILLTRLHRYINEVQLASAKIDHERLMVLDGLVSYIMDRKEQPIHLVFICTHNSRRSHMAQIWAQVLAGCFGMTRIQTYSGGTEATAFNPRAVEAIRNAGLNVTDPGGDNPKYKIHYSDHLPPFSCWSKKYDDPVNPSSDFCAVMTCSDADESCPVVIGAQKRVSLYYNDPKESDNTPEEKKVYRDRCLQIASEMHYVMKKASGDN